MRGLFLFSPSALDYGHRVAAGKSRSRIALPPPTRDHSRLGQPRDVRTMYLSGESILIILVVGLIAGWLAGRSYRARAMG